MSEPKSVTNHGRIRRSALFMLAALAAEVVSLRWTHPLSFYVFGLVGALLVLSSVVSLLLSLVSRPAEMEILRRVESEDEERRAAAG
ncbi:MAG TPA: hypothetical protein VLT84_10215 [Acidobacteriota bacterium]|nr:hypothetical protein [Acidobacteriota bacterium]